VRELDSLSLEEGRLWLIHGKTFPHEDRQAIEKVVRASSLGIFGSRLQKALSYLV